MGFFRKAQHPSAVIIDLSASRVAGAYVYYPDGEGAVICASFETPVQPRTDETREQSLLRALDRVGESLIEVGAPELRRQIGTGRPESVLISVAAPWQQVRVQRHTVAPPKEFTLTKRVVSDALAAGAAPQTGWLRLPDTVIATLLNGYDVPQPLGMRTKRAELIVLSASIDEALADAVRSSVRRLYHTHDITFTSFAAASYGALRAQFPHEKEFLILDVSASGTDLACVKGGRLVDVASLPEGVESLLVAARSAERLTVEEEAAALTSYQPGYINPDRNARFGKRVGEAKALWTENLVQLFRVFAKQYALPRTLFLIADPASHEYLKSALDSDAIHGLWLSDEPLSVIPIVADQLARSVQARGIASPDAYLSLLALYHRFHTA
jgi:hypothetical protein